MYYSSLHLGDNSLAKLPTLPQNLKHLDCYNNNLTELPELSKTLEQLYCENNNLIELPELPQTLTHLDCYNNNLTQLPTLPHNLSILDCHNNNLTELPELPKTLRLLYCHNNNLIALSKLPSKLTHLNCDNNNLNKLPKQTKIDFKNNFTLKNIIINFIIKNPFKINNTSIPQDLTDIVLNSKLFKCDFCQYNLPECTKYKKYYIDKKWKVCCYELSCINCNFKN